MLRRLGTFVVSIVNYDDLIWNFHFTEKLKPMFGKSIIAKQKFKRIDGGLTHNVDFKA